MWTKCVEERVTSTFKYLSSDKKSGEMSSKLVYS